MKGGKYLKKENIWSVKMKKNAEGKGGKYLEKENISPSEEQKNGTVKGGKYLKKENTWSAMEEKKRKEGKRRKIFGGGKSDDGQTNKITSLTLDSFQKFFFKYSKML